MKTDRTKKLLIDENALRLLPTLGAAIGVTESIVLQQIHYWLYMNRNSQRHKHDGVVWCWNSIADWHQNDFRCWSKKTVQRALESLRGFGLLIIRKDLNRKSYDTTGWYTIDYDRLDAILKAHNDYDPYSKRLRPVVKMTTTIPEYPQNHSKSSSKTADDKAVSNVNENQNQNLTPIEQDQHQDQNLNPTSTATPPQDQNQNLTPTPTTPQTLPSGKGLGEILPLAPRECDCQIEAPMAGVKDVLNHHLEQRGLRKPKADKPMQLGILWKAKMAEAGHGFQGDLTGEDVGKLKGLFKLYRTETAQIVAWLVLNWSRARRHVEIELKLPDGPIVPCIGYVVKHKESFGRAWQQLGKVRPPEMGKRAKMAPTPLIKGESVEEVASLQQIQEALSQCLPPTDG